MLCRPGRCLFLAAIVALLLAAPSALATFPGDNGRISLHRVVGEGEDEGINAFTIRPDGTGLMELSPFEPGVYTLYSDWSPDGRQLAFDPFIDDRAQIWTINANGTGARQLTDATNGAFDPAWAPDGRTLAIEGDFGDDPGIFLIPARARHGTLITRAQARRVTRNTDGFDSEPQVSPDGRWIAFTRYTACGEQGCATQIFRVRANGGPPQPLTRPDLHASAPDWHPSGQWIAIDSHDNGVAPNLGHIIVMRPDGSGKRIIVRGDADDYFNNPSFSPDGRQMTFARWGADEEEPSSRIWVAGADGRGARQLLDSPTADNKPDWGSAPKRGHHGR